MWTTKRQTSRETPFLRMPKWRSVERGLQYVSRGGLKLEKAMKEFGLTLTGKVCMDIGASTGGFTDCMLQNGAVKVYSVDVGYGQLAWSLRTDPRVVNYGAHQCPVPDPGADSGGRSGFVSVDVSFISLTIILPAVRPLLEQGGQAVCLIKPQFEAGREKVGKKGVVRDRAVHQEVIEKIRDFALQNGYSVLGLTYSPVKGPEGNIEYLIYLERSDSPSLRDGVPDAAQVVEASHQELDRPAGK